MKKIYLFVAVLFVVTQLFFGCSGKEETSSSAAPTTSSDVPTTSSTTNSNTSPIAEEKRATPISVDSIDLENLTIIEDYSSEDFGYTLFKKSPFS